jgi:hypothetical protein
MNGNNPGAASGATPKVKSLNCPSCGATLIVRSFDQAVTIVCDSCHSILDAKDPNLQILQKFKLAMGGDAPWIPLGTRGTIRGAQYEVIGFQRRTIHVDGIPYSWHEYLLFNPYKGFRYLTEYNGHWNDVSTLRSLPNVDVDTQVTVDYLGETYKHFQTAQAETTFVLGEFPWQVRVGEAATVTDYISPPRVLSCEKTKDESTWSMGEYVTGRDIWRAFGLAGDPPQAVGVYENQPSPLRANTKAVWNICGVFLAGVIVLLAALYSAAGNQRVFQHTYTFSPDAAAEGASFVSDEFQLQGRTSDVEIHTNTDLNNNWIYLNYALINQDTGQAFDFGREVSYYSGYDEDGSWTEGNREDTAVVASVPPGNYYLRVEPESDRGHGSISYAITITRDVPQLSFFGIAFIALVIPAGLITWRSMNFEHLRWAESDYGSSDSGSGGGDDNDNDDDEDKDDK